MNSDLRVLARPLIALVIFNLLPAFYLRPVWITIFAFALVGYRLLLDITKRPVPPRWLLFTVQIGVGLAIWQNFHSFFGDEAGGAFLTLLTCLKVYELKRSRDFFITGVLCLLVLMSYLLLDQGLTMTVYMVADVAAIMTFFYALQMERWNWKLWRQMATPSVALVLKSLPLVVLMFVLFPRFNTGFGHTGDLKGKTGISDSLRPGSVAELVGSDELIFRASFLDGNVPPQSQLYWRGAVLDRSHGMNWDRAKTTQRKFQPTFAPQSPDLEIYLEPGSDKFLFSLENTESLGFPNASGFRMHTREGRIYELSEALQTRERYYIQRGQNSTAEADAPENYLEVGETPSPELQKFLQKYKDKSESETVHDLLENFRTGGYHYSLKPPPSSNLDEFLFKTKTGFCEHFAGTMGTLLRNLKIPSRVVMGFQGGTQSFFENYISVRGHDAHSWVEYYDRSDKRWRRIDPTAQVEPLRVNQGSDALFEEGRNLMPAWMPGAWLKPFLNARAFIDEVEANWTGFLLRFDLARQKELLAKLGMEEVLFRALGVFLVLSVGLILAVLYFFEAQRKEPLSADEKLYRQLLQVLKKWRIEKSAQEGPLTLMAKIAAVNARLAEQVEPILAPLVNVRYGREHLSPAHIAEMRRRLRGLKRFRV